MSLIGNYQTSPFSKNRQILSEIYEEFSRKHYMRGLIEIDITDGLRKIEMAKKKNNIDISYTAWIAKCVAEAVKIHPKINSYRKGKRLITFEDIDIIVMIEKEVNGVKNPFPMTLRSAENKSLDEITKQIRSFQKADVDMDKQILDQGLKTRLYFLIPKPIRKWIIRRELTDPFTIKKKGGFIVITSVGMFSQNNGWILGFGGIATMSISVGGRSQKWEKIEDEFVERTYQSLTIEIDHDIIDGAPATRFVSSLNQFLITGAYIS